MAKNNKRKLMVVRELRTRYGDDAALWEKELSRKGGRPRGWSTDDYLDFYLWCSAFQRKGLSIAIAGKSRGLNADITHRRHKQAHKLLGRMIDPRLDVYLESFLQEFPTIRAYVERVVKKQFAAKTRRIRHLLPRR